MYQTKVIPNPQPLRHSIRIILLPSGPPNRRPRPPKLTNPPRQIIEPNDRHPKHHAIPTDQPTIECPPALEGSILRGCLAFGERRPDRQNQDCLQGFDVAGDVEEGEGEQAAGFGEEGGHEGVEGGGAGEVA